MKFNYFNKSDYIEENHKEFLEEISANCSSEFEASLYDLRNLLKLVSIVGGELLEVRNSNDGLVIFVKFVSHTGSIEKEYGKFFNITNLALEKDVNQCLEDRKCIFKLLGETFNGKDRFFKNTSNAIQLVNDYFESMEGSKRFVSSENNNKFMQINNNLNSNFETCTIPEFVELIYGENWKNDRRKFANAKLLNATCGTQIIDNKKMLSYCYSAIVDSLIDVMEKDKQFQPRTKPNTTYVSDKVSAIEEVQINMEDTGSKLKDGNYYVDINEPQLSNYINKMIKYSGEEICDSNFIIQDINEPV